MIIEIGLLYGKNQGPIEERMQMVRSLLFLNDGIGPYSEYWRYSQNRVIVVAEVPKDRVYLHHGFDSKLNKQWPDGAGAGWVVEKESN